MNKKELKELIDYSIERLKRDNQRDFIIKNGSYTNKYDIYEVINNKECYMYGSLDLERIHDSLCVIYNFLQTEKLYNKNEVLN